MATARELIQRGMVAVRNSATLYPRYQELFNEAFGYFPECPTCGSLLGQNQWKAFAAFAEGANPNTLLTKNNYSAMTATNKTFEIKDKSKLYSFNFKKKGQERVFTSRNYGDVMTEEFANEYLENAKDNPELFNQRKAEFKILPRKFADKKEAKPANEAVNAGAGEVVVDLSKLKLVELQNLATERGYPAQDWDKIKSKADMITYIEAKELEAKPANEAVNAGAEDTDTQNSGEGDAENANSTNEDENDLS